MSSSSGTVSFASVVAGKCDKIESSRYRSRETRRSPRSCTPLPPAYLSSSEPTVSTSRPPHKKTSAAHLTDSSLYSIFKEEIQHELSPAAEPYQNQSRPESMNDFYNNGFDGNNSNSNTIVVHTYEPPTQYYFVPSFPPPCRHFTSEGVCVAGGACQFAHSYMTEYGPVTLPTLGLLSPPPMSSYADYTVYDPL